MSPVRIRWRRPSAVVAGGTVTCATVSVISRRPADFVLRTWGEEIKADPSLAEQQPCPTLLAGHAGPVRRASPLTHRVCADDKPI